MDHTEDINPIIAGVLVGLISLSSLIYQYTKKATWNPTIPPITTTQILHNDHWDPLPITLNQESNGNEVEVLLHNVSHADLIMSVYDKYNQLQSDCIIARPKFSCFRAISSAIKRCVCKIPLSELATVEHPVYWRESAGRYPISTSSDNSRRLQVGFDLKNLNARVNNTRADEQLRFRQSDMGKVDSDAEYHVLSAVYFPLLAMLIPKWLSQVEMRGKYGSRKILFLVSGQGTPRDSTARVQDNSTEKTAQLMELFIKKVYPSIEVILVHGDVNLFKYNHNILFVKRDLLPRIEEIRNDLADRVGAKWIENFHLTMSFADGSSARVSAINAALRPYKPTYMHFWQLKTFWYETKVCMDDIDCHTYQEISTIPAIKLDDTTNPTVRLVAEEMVRFKKEFERVQSLPEDQHDVSTFWLRKTRKPVLGVLLVQKPGKPPKLYRGTNMEVSMPTGSLCAERNVIGSALADDLALRRRDIRCVAVLSMSLDKENPVGQSNEKEICCENGDLIAPVPRDFPPSSSCSGSPMLLPSESETSTPTLENLSLPANESVLKCDDTSTPPPTVLAFHQSLTSPPSSPNRAQIKRSSSLGSGYGTPGRRKRTVQVYDMKPSEKQKGVSRKKNNDGAVRRRDSDAEAEDSTSAVKGRPSVITSNPSFAACQHNPQHEAITVADSDMNPLKPCGACLEWLKKIAEVNPSFTVVTFTDADCKGIYIEQIEI